MNHRVLALLGGLCLASAATADDCEHRAERNLDLDAGAFATLALRAGAGDLDIRGEPGLATIEVRGTACASEAEWLEEIQLVQRTEGDRVIVEARIPDQEQTSWFGNSYRRLDLRVRMPARMLLDAADTSGDLQLTGVAGATVTDTSGDLEVDAIAGELRITDTSGDIEVSDVGGTLHVVADSSGDIEAEGIGGDALIEVDSSGDITLRQVRGDARVRLDSSGGIRFTDIDGSATVGTDSSGSIEATRIGRDFTVENDSTGGIEHRDVAGVVRVPEH